MPDARFPLLVETTELDAALTQPELRVVFVGPAEVYAQAHIPGASRIEYADLNRQRPPAGGLLPDMATLGRVLGDAGITPDTHVIAYDATGNAQAARLLWTLDCLGHSAHSLLNGGLPAWLADGLATHSEHSTHSSDAMSAAIANPLYPAELKRPELIAELTDIQAHLDDPQQQILDARSLGEYRGEDVRAAQGGHIPGAVHREWSDNIDPDNAYRLRPRVELAAAHAKLGLREDQAIIAHCQTHHRSSLSVLVLRYLGYPHVSGYAGSWSEWGNTPECPVVVGDTPR